MFWLAPKNRDALFVKKKPEMGHQHETARRLLLGTHRGGIVEIETLCAVPFSNFPSRASTEPNTVMMCFQGSGVLTAT
jgi:hypothetical protein